jgi:hypothetical protein
MYRVIRFRASILARGRYRIKAYSYADYVGPGVEYIERIKNGDRRD